MRSSLLVDKISNRVVRASDSQCQSCNVSWVRSQHPPDTVESEGRRQMKQCRRISYIKRKTPKKSPFNNSRIHRILMHNNAANHFFLLSVIPTMPKFGSNFRITDLYLGGQLLTDPPDPDAKQCRKYIFSRLSVIPPVPKFGSNFRITDPYLGGQLLPDPDSQQCRKSFFLSSQ
jgi:hypothetical protein